MQGQTQEPQRASLMLAIMGKQLSFRVTDSDIPIPTTAYVFV